MRWPAYREQEYIATDNKEKYENASVDTDWPQTYSTMCAVLSASTLYVSEQKQKM